MFSTGLMFDDRYNVVANNDMIENLDSNNLSSLLKSIRDRQVLLAWRRVAGWVVVREQDSRRCLLHCCAKHFAGMH
jgi:hypothetical protein